MCICAIFFFLLVCVGERWDLLVLEKNKTSLQMSVLCLNYSGNPNQWWAASRFNHTLWKLVISDGLVVLYFVFSFLDLSETEGELLGSHKICLTLSFFSSFRTT